jgi:hypothetical protein
MKKIYSLILIICLSVSVGYANDAVKDAFKKGIKFNFDESGKNFAKISAGSQLWMRYTELNPGTLDAMGEEIESDIDFLVRRNYFNTLVAMDRLTFFTMFGITSQPATVSLNPGNKAPSFFVYDAFGSYAFIPEYLTLGFGLNMYGGVSRYHMVSSSSCMGADVPMAPLQNLLTTNQAGRRLNFFAHGRAFEKVTYQANVYKPFVPDEFNPVNTPAVDRAGEYKHYNLGYSGRLEFQLFDKESAARLPFKASSHLGAKKLLNIGIGGDFLKEGAMSYDPAVNTPNSPILHDKIQVAADVFFDTPLKNGAALTAYGLYHYSDFGPNYLHSYGVQSIWGGAAIAEPQNGTGQCAYGQLAYTFPKFDNGSRFQGFATASYKDFEALEEEIISWTAGVTYFYIGHKVKFTLEYLNRPYLENGEVDSYKSQVIGKLQIGI